MHTKTERPGSSSMFRAGESRRIKASGLHIAIMIRTLMEGPNTLNQLAEATGLHWRTCRGWVAELKRQKLVRLSGMAPDTRGYLRTPLFEWAPDKPDWRPKKITSTERSRAYRERKKRQKVDTRIGRALVCATTA